MATTGGGGYRGQPPLSVKKYRKIKMAIRFISTSSPKTAVRTRGDVAPLDGRVASDALRKIDLNYRNGDENYRNAKRGRPVTGAAMTNAERQRRYRARLKDRAAASQPL